MSGIVESTHAHALLVMVESEKGTVRTGFEKILHFAEIIKCFSKRELKDCEKLPVICFRDWVFLPLRARVYFP